MDLPPELAVLADKVLSLSPVVLVALGSAVLILALAVGRVLFNLLPSKRPPVWEGLPFIGGLLKFTGVSALA